MEPFEVLATECDNPPACPKIVRLPNGRIVTVGLRTSDPATISISWSMWREATRSLGPDHEGSLAVIGVPITDPALLREYGVGENEAAVELDEAALLAAGSRPVPAV